MPNEQFQRVKQNQNSSPESSQEDRESRVTSYTRNDAIRNQTHEAGKDVQRARYSQSGCCQVCHRSSQWSRRQWRCRRKPNTAEVTETRRTKSSWHEKQPDCDSVEQHPSVQNPGAQAQSKQKRTRDQQAFLRRCLQASPSAILKRKTSANPKLSWEMSSTHFRRDFKR